MMKLKLFDPRISEKRFQRFLQSNCLIAFSRCLHIDHEVMESTLKSDRKYHKFPIPKKKGGKRIIHAPARPLRDIQERLYVFLNRMYGFYAPEYVHGFVKKQTGRNNTNILTNAEHHVGKAWVLNLDIEDFFPSITSEQIRSALLENPVNLASKETASIIALLGIYNWRLPAGSPCSPVLSNIVFYQTDLKLKALCDAKQLVYTRYADDLTFSANVKIKQPVIEEIRNILKSAGFHINPRKIRLQSRHGAQYVTGIKVNEKLNINRRYLRNLRAILHNWNLHGIEQAAGQYYAAKKHIFRNKEAMQLSFINSVGGRLGFLQAVKQEDDVVRKLSDLFTKLKNS